jgi:Uma2 family endonuclease
LNPKVATKAEGRIIDMSPSGPFHGEVTTYLAELFAVASRGRWRTRTQNSLRLDDFSEPQPDLILAKPIAETYRRRHPRAEEVYLLIEVSDTSLEADQEDKLPAYGRAGVPEVWIVNLNELAVEVYREPHFTGYGSKTVRRAGDQVFPQAFPDAVVDVGEWLKR